MKIIAWNLNHRTREKKIPDEIVRFLESYSPDVVTLNEYVDGPSRDKFYGELNDLGYSNVELWSTPKEIISFLLVQKSQWCVVLWLPHNTIQRLFQTSFM